MRTNESEWLPEDIIDTRKLQIYALEQMMSALGYGLMKSSVEGNWYFHSNKYSNKGREKISIRTAIKLFNGDTARCVFGRPPQHLTIWAFDDFSIAKAKASRILRSLKIQYCRQTKQIIVQDHRVQFITPSYKALFLNNQYL